jgi:hypothetical protein
MAQVARFIAVRGGIVKIIDDTANLRAFRPDIVCHSEYRQKQTNKNQRA